MQEMVNKGIISKERFLKLTDNRKKWKHDYILHEAGVPPIHTFFYIFLLNFYLFLSPVAVL